MAQKYPTKGNVTEALDELTWQLDKEAGEMQVIGMHYNRHGDSKTGMKYIAQAEARWHLIRLYEADKEEV